MSKKNETTENLPALIEDRFPILNTEEAQDALEAIKGLVGSGVEHFSVRDLGRIKVPAGGGTAWKLPTADGMKNADAWNGQHQAFVDMCNANGDFEYTGVQDYLSMYPPNPNDVIHVDAARHPAMTVLAEKIHGWMPMALHGFTAAPFWLALAGVAASYYMYMVNPALPAAIQRSFRPIYSLLENKYYLDWFNENVIARGARLLGSGLWKAGDRALIDGLVVNGSWRLVGWVAGMVRWVQSGYLYHYALVMILGIFVLMTYFVWLNK